MNGILFQELTADKALGILIAIAPEIAPATLIPAEALVEVAELPFYDEIKLYALTDLRLPTQNPYYLLCKPGFAALMDGTKVPIFRANQFGPIKLNSETLVPYLRFFFQYVKGPLNGYTIVESPEDFPWLPDADDSEKAEVAAKLMPVSFKGTDRRGLLTATCTVIFLNALFRTNIEVAPCEMELKGRRKSVTQHLAAGEMRFAKVSLLLEALSIEYNSSLDDGPDASEIDADALRVNNLFPPRTDIPPLAGLALQEMAAEAAQEILDAVAPEILPVKLTVGQTRIAVAELPFYDGFKFYTITDMSLPPPNEFNVLYGPSTIKMMNGTNEPIYSLNELAPIKLTAETLPSYAKFFFHYVRGEIGRFIIVEKPEDVVWLPKATQKEKSRLATRLMPLTYQGVDGDGLFTLTGTVIFRNALFRTDIKVAPREMDVFDPELGVPEHLTIGELKLTNEELLLEELNVPVDTPSGEVE